MPHTITGRLSLLFPSARGDLDVQVDVGRQGFEQRIQRKHAL
jgi:hypothetical protein